MTSTEDLVRELHTQADATRSWPAPVVPHRRTARRPSRLGATAIVLATAVAVVIAVVAVPRLLAIHGQPTPLATAIRPLSPAEVAEQRAAERKAQRAAQEAQRLAQAQAWVATRCPKDDRLGCDAPFSLTHDGRSFTSSDAGGSVPTRHGEVRSPSMGSPVSRGGDHWFLVGAKGSGESSRLQFRVGTGPWQPLPAGRPSLLQVTTATRFEHVIVRDLTRPLPREILMIQEYTPAP